MSIHCSYCHKQGHNRTTCEARKERVAVLMQDYDKNRYHDLVLEEERRVRQKKHRSAIGRKCSYCMGRYWAESTDHNRRNCPRKAEDMAKAVSLNKEWRVSMYVAMAELGIGPGAIVKDTRSGVCVVKEVKWDAMNHFVRQGWGCSPIVISPMKQNARDYAMNLPYDEQAMPERRTWTSLEKVLVPCTERLLNASIPDDWYDGESGLDYYFKKENDKYF